MTGYGYLGARNDTTQQTNSCLGIHRQTHVSTFKGTATLEPKTTQHNSQDRLHPGKEVEIKNITVCQRYSETDTTGMLSSPTVWRQQSAFVSSRQSGLIPAAVLIGFECRCNAAERYGHACRIKCSHTCLRCYTQTNVAVPLDVTVILTHSFIHSFIH